MRKWACNMNPLLCLCSWNFSNVDSKENVTNGNDSFLIAAIDLDIFFGVHMNDLSGPPV